MASKTKKLETIRDRKAARRGRKRKAALRTKGSTKSQQALFGDAEAKAPKAKKVAAAAAAKAKLAATAAAKAGNAAARAKKAAAPAKTKAAKA
jgi:hypothetical protein